MAWIAPGSRTLPILFARELGYTIHGNSESRTNRLIPGNDALRLKLKGFSASELTKIGFFSYARKMKTILVTGDLVWDTHIARLPWTGKGYFQPHEQTQLKNHYGGAWYLREVIDVAAKAAGVEAVVVAPERAKHEEIEEDTGPGGIAKGFTVWEWFREDKSGAWRIKEFLGCQSARWGPRKEGGDDADLCQGKGQQPAKPDVLVIDDLGLGFSANERAWPPCLANPSNGPEAIVVKASATFDRPLWKKLLSPEWAGRVTVVVTGAMLREVGARLGRGFSWDQTIEEVQRVFAAGGAGWPLRYCHRVVVIFGRSGAAVFSREPQAPEVPEPLTLAFERFVFDPMNLEASWSAGVKGRTFGVGSLITASVVVQELTAEVFVDQETGVESVIKPSSHLTLSTGLGAARELHRRGADGDLNNFRLDGIEEECFKSVVADKKLTGTFRSAFNRELLDAPVLVKSEEVPEPSLLTDALGVSIEFLTVAAEAIVRFGGKQALASVPSLKCGKYFTVDRTEIESLNSVRNLIQDYQANAGDTRPLSIAVFGQPGSGKSFAIKQLAEALFGKEKAVLEYNLSQFEDREDLHEAFHEVRDKSVQGQLPLVFWDEFDSGRGEAPLAWLKEFLAPMQDAKFLAKGKEHPFGKCIFIFAGGTSTTFNEFDQSGIGDDTFKKVKGPDFVSRLRGFVNIKGPNPIAGEHDEVHVVRRALLLRSFIERYHRDVIHPDSGELMMHPAVLTAFLQVRKYCHGARSMESIISLSRLHESRHFGPSELPAPEVVQLHVTADFTQIVNDQTRVHFGPPDIERLATIMHESWVRQKTGAGWTKGDQPGRDPAKKTDSRLVPYGELSRTEKEDNRTPARLTLLRMDKLGYQVRRADETDSSSVIDLAAETESRHRIAQSEHRRWMREKLLAGVSFATHTDDPFLRHADLRKFDQLPGFEQRLDYGIAEAIVQFFKEEGLVIVKKEGNVPSPAVSIE